MHLNTNIHTTPVQMIAHDQCVCEYRRIYKCRHYFPQLLRTHVYSVVSLFALNSKLSMRTHIYVKLMLMSLN